MKLELNEHKKGVAEVAVEVSPEELRTYQEHAAVTVGKELEVEGFRKGKAPLDVVVRKVGDRTILAEAAQLAISDAFRQATKEHNLAPISDPEAVITKLAPGNPLEFKLRIPVMPEVSLSDYASIAGKIERRTVEVSQQEVEDALRWLAKSRVQDGKEAPEPTDELARSIGAFENLDALRASIKEGLESEKVLGETQRLRQEVLEKVAEASRLDLPSQLVSSEQRSMAENLKEGVKMSLQIPFEEYLKRVKKSEDEIISSFEEEARKRVRNYLVLRAIAAQEGIESTKEEIEEEASRVLSQYQNKEKAAKSIDPLRLREYTELVVRNEKTLAYLESLTKKPA